MKFLDLNGVSILWQRIKETFARKSETISEISRDDTTFTVTRADGTTFEFDQKDTTYENATTTTAGLMSAADKAKLNGVAEGAQENIIESISVNDVEQQVTSKGVNITIPTALSQLSDDVGYLTEESDPTVPEWAKQPQKPAYTASEVGALPADTDIPTKVSDLKNDADYVSFEDIPVKTVNGKSGDVEITAADLGALTEHQDISGKADKADLAAVAMSGDYGDLINTPAIPTATSDLTNDSDFVDDEFVSNAINDALAGFVGIEYHVCTTGEYDTTTLIPTLTGKVGTIYLVPKDGNEAANIYYEYIYANNSFEKIGDTEVDLSNYLRTTDIAGWAKAISKPKYTAAEVGALPSDTYIPTKVSDLTNDAGYLTEHQDISGKANTADLAKVATSGSYNDLSNKPTIPTVPTKVSAFTNDASYTNEQYVDNAITAALADVVGIEYHVCTTEEYDDQTYLPTLAGEVGVIYLVPKPASLIGSAVVGTDAVSGNNIYYEFIYNGRSFEMIGDTQVSLDGYLENSDVSTDAQVQSVITEVFGGV